MSASLEETARRLAMPGKGLLASDESTGTIGKRLEKAGFENSEVTGAGGGERGGESSMAGGGRGKEGLWCSLPTYSPTH